MSVFSTRKKMTIALLCAAMGLAGLAASRAVAMTNGDAAGVEAAEIGFTDAQAKNGQKIFQESCATCHGSNLMGGAGPALSGDVFKNTWLNGKRKVSDLFAGLSGMPLNAPRSLSDQQYSDLIVYLLSRNGYKAGPMPFNKTMMNVVLLPDGQSWRKRDEGDDIQEESKLNLPATPVHVGQASTSMPTDADILNPSDADWLLYNRDYKGQRFSKLDQINTKNAGKLVPKCILQMSELGTFQTGPVVYNGVMYITTANNTVAVDGASCKRIWSYEYVPSGRTPNPVNRGVTIYQGKLLRVTPDAHLIAIDAADGRLLWDAHVSDSEIGYFLSAAPIAYDGKVFIGEAGAEWGAEGHIYAFDVNNGKRLWTFNVIPKGDEAGAESWGNGGAKNGGGSMWTTLTLDAATRRLFVSVGNPAPDFDGSQRPGDNLYTDSVVVLDIDTGKLDWYAQQNPHDVRDYDTAAAPVIYEQDGKSYMAVGSKDGFLYLYDRDSHKLLQRIVTTTIKNNDVPLSLDKDTYVCPGTLGGTEWNGPAYSPERKTLYLNTVDFCANLRLAKHSFVKGEIYFGGSFVLDPAEAARGWTRAFDAATGELKWARKADGPMIAGVTPTSGGVIFTGEARGDFVTLDAETGKALYSFNTGGAVAGGVMTYLAGGKQYVAAITGNSSRSLWGHTGSATLIIFGLP